MIARRMLLAASTNGWLREKATKTAFVRRSVSAFMPGERLADAMAAASAQQANGVRTIFTKLGENLTRASDAEGVTGHYLEALDDISAAGLDAQISVKPTQLGLDFDAALCLDNLRRLVHRASERRNFVWLDMESSPYVDRTLHLFRQLRERSDRVGVALQAYLGRTAADLESLMPLGPSVRDTRLVDRLAAYIAGRQGQVAPYEYAMLYGIQRSLQERLLEAGQPLRVLIAYGDYWFPWYMRRLAERPANVWFVLKNAFSR
jgi:proline dehydrogenase